jgi:hypothetical protein
LINAHTEAYSKLQLLKCKADCKHAEGAALVPAVSAGWQAAAYLFRCLIIDGKLDHNKIGVLQQQQQCFGHGWAV